MEVWGQASGIPGHIWDLGSPLADCCSPNNDSKAAYNCDFDLSQLDVGQHELLMLNGQLVLRNATGSL
ncbi:MAG: hypothetical protein ABL921_34895, partial [Pirellula sp.]